MTLSVVCSTDGRMTVVADLSLAIPSGSVPARTNLLDKYCGPKESDSTRALFSFQLNSCGSTVKVLLSTNDDCNGLSHFHKLIYMCFCFLSLARNMWHMKTRFSSAGSCELWKIQTTAMILKGESSTLNLLVIHASWTSHNAPSLSCRVTMQCTYPLSGLHRLFSVYRFESEDAGIGHIVHSAHSAEGKWFSSINPTSLYKLHADNFVWSCTPGQQSPTIEPTTVFQTPVPTIRQTIRPILFRPSRHPPARYIKVSRFLLNLQKKGWYLIKTWLQI